MIEQPSTDTKNGRTVVWLSSPPRPSTLLARTCGGQEPPEAVPCTRAQHEALLAQMFPHETERRILEWIVAVADNRTGDRCIDFHIDRAENAAHARLRDVRETAQRMKDRHEAAWRELARANDDLQAQRAAGAPAAVVSAATSHLRALRENAVESILRAGAWKHDVK